MYHTLPALSVIGVLLLAVNYEVLGENTSIQFPSKRKVPMPPLITKEPDPEVVFRLPQRIDLPCLASGEPAPVYYWKRNGEEFYPGGNDGRVTIKSGEGTLQFERSLEGDEGVYQCFAQNEFGIALTVKIALRMAILEEFAAIITRYHHPSLGHPLTLRCVPPRSYPPADLFWASIDDDGGIVPVELSNRVSMDWDGNLHFVNVVSEDNIDGRMYTCIAQNTILNSTQQGEYAVIKPQGSNGQLLPSSILWHSPTHQVALRGEVWRIKCIFSGNPSTRVNWVRVDAEMPDRARQESYGQELTIENVRDADAGLYECQGINEMSQTPTRRSFTLRVEAAPFWIKRPESVLLVEFEDAVIHCEAGGIPDTENVWFLDGTPLSNIPRDDRREAENDKITFRNVTKEDNQVVQCNSTNKFGSVFHNAYLSVLSEPPIILSPPLETHVVAEGKTVYLQCEVFGSPKPSVVWTRGNEQLTGSRFKVMEEGHLQITDVMLSDAGLYTCTVTNRLDVVSAGGTLVVRQKTQIQLLPQDVTVREGETVNFMCTATTDPEELENLRIEWKKDGKMIEYDADHRITLTDIDNSLTISGATSSDMGTYGCIATNGLDEDEATAQLVVQAPPDPPINVEVVCRNQQGYTEIKWQPGNDNRAPILSFIVQFNTSFTPDTWIDIVSNVSQNECSSMVTLSPYGNYTFRVLARNEFGLSDPSEHTANTCMEPPAIPDKNPENVVGEGDEPNNLVIFWTVS